MSADGILSLTSAIPVADSPPARPQMFSSRDTQPRSVAGDLDSVWQNAWLRNTTAAISGYRKLTSERELLSVLSLGNRYFSLISCNQQNNYCQKPQGQESSVQPAANFW